jgi:hypothetical protein
MAVSSNLPIHTMGGVEHEYYSILKSVSQVGGKLSDHCCAITARCYADDCPARQPSVC